MLTFWIYHTVRTTQTTSPVNHLLEAKVQEKVAAAIPSNQTRQKKRGTGDGIQLRAHSKQCKNRKETNMSGMQPGN